MSEPDHDGWPDKYSDPRERPHPDVLRITVESFDEAFEDTRDAIGAIADGEPRPAVVSFATVGELRKILTDRRIELLQVLMDTDSAAESISALAETLDRDYKTVHDDVTLLAEYGVMFLVEDDDRAKRPYLPYGRIRLDVELNGSNTDEEPAAA
ncbi:hypothetical protein EXE46_15440 [Halorubrum sp. GN11_10-6_MGM]|uniref:HVO_A0114 family putative DNA-binding protein n=1 Tax=Halorubrum sp. GN11_10-6_MGM TaxID=2518112 RepID=UPI0010F49114|nr:hypothetical protein [Halorubrum sp. GN11_10-6_MGM]TKX72744.1 hypothetical protein EXE46_15440 [Halorubrum sp. GN11_10-6_MGM]